LGFLKNQRKICRWKYDQEIRIKTWKQNFSKSTQQLPNFQFKTSIKTWTYFSLQFEVLLEDASNAEKLLINQPIFRRDCISKSFYKTYLLLCPIETFLKSEIAFQSMWSSWWFQVVLTVTTFSCLIFSSQAEQTPLLPTQRNEWKCRIDSTQALPQMCIQNVLSLLIERLIKFLRIQNLLTTVESCIMNKNLKRFESKDMAKVKKKRSS